jgi:hypothetical protein
MFEKASRVIHASSLIAFVAGAALLVGCGSGGGDSVEAGDQHLETGGGGAAANKTPAPAATGDKTPAATTPTPTPPPPIACSYAPVNVGNGKFTAGSLQVDLGDGNDPTKPTVWEGPIVITKGRASCTVDEKVSLLNGAMWFDGSKFLVGTFSGSSDVLYAVDSNCKILWNSDSYTGKAFVDATGITLQNLEEGGGESPPTRVSFQSNCLP